MQITNLPKYDKYKPSGVKWLGEIPEQWKIHRLGSVLDNVSERNRTDLPLLSITREKGVILRDLDNEEENHNYIPDDLTNYKVLKNGQFGMNKMKAWQGSYGVSKQDGIVSPAYFIFQMVKEINPEFFHIAIRSKIYISFFGSASDGVRIGQWDLSKERMKQIPFLLPSLPEQTAIANFLDRKTALIDKAIAIKEKQIELLKERKQIIIHNAVTRGLNPNVKMKPSGVEWIGEIPEHWEVKRLKYIMDKILTGTTPTTSNQDLFDGDLDWFNPKDLNSEVLTSSERKLSQLALKRKEIKMFPGDSILVVCVGATTGKTSYLLRCGTFNQQITGFKTSNFSNKYYYYQISSFSKILLSRANYTTLPILTNEFFKTFLLAIPPINEQIAIAEYIKSSTSRIIKAIGRVEKEIEKLKEYKSTLIDSAVTGKIKVW